MMGRAMGGEVSVFLYKQLIFPPDLQPSAARRAPGGEARLWEHEVAMEKVEEEDFPSQPCQGEPWQVVSSHADSQGDVLSAPRTCQSWTHTQLCPRPRSKGRWEPELQRG